MPDASPGVLRLPDIAYERVPVTTTINGKPFAADGWVNGPGCPGRIKAEYSRARHRMVTSEDAGAVSEFLTDAMRIVLDIDYETADLLAGDIERADAILVHLKWREPTVASEGDADPEATGAGGTPTTRPSSPTSAPLLAVVPVTG